MMEASSWALAAFCRVTSFISATALLNYSIPWDCSLEADASSAMSLTTFEARSVTP